jgi:purine-nucleoside phosphorylase
LEQKNVIIMQGRFHYYEGYSMQEIVFPVRVMRDLGIRTLLITNAAGGINKTFVPGDLMIIDDYINLMFDNPLIGQNDPQLGPRFPDMSNALSPTLIDAAFKAAESLNVPIRRGIYIGVQGPYYASVAEGRLTRLLGGDAVGMSTVPEIIAAAHMGIDILGISCITDVDREPDPDKQESLNHSDVVSIANQSSPKLAALIRAVLRRI